MRYSHQVPNYRIKTVIVTTKNYFLLSFLLRVQQSQIAARESVFGSSEHSFELFSAINLEIPSRCDLHRADFTAPPLRQAVSFTFQEYGVDFYFAQMWFDKRLMLHNLPGGAIINLIGKDVEEVWLPDTVFVNSKYSKFHQVTISNRFLSLNMSNGKILYHSR